MLDLTRELVETLTRGGSHGFELKAGVTDADSLEAWVAGIPAAVRPKLAAFVRSADVTLLDLGTNPHADLGEAAVAGLEASS